MAPSSLPPGFVEAVGELLTGPDELAAFVDGYTRPSVRGLRVNTAKAGPAAVAALLGVPAAPVPWAPTGLVLPAPPPPGLGDRLAHRAGLYYLQEPSAMAPAEVLAAALADRVHGARVIDLAAAPGGKTTRLSELVGPDGLVVANEIDRNRLGVLHENLDRWGAANVVTTAQSLDRLARASPAGFDAALLDAPCTGEGMFRRDPAARSYWSPAAVRGSARRQALLLAEATRLVRPGGVLVYSTCTFAVQENEQVVANVLAAEPAWSVADARVHPAFAPGVDVPAADGTRMARLWPHRLEGEGQFVALLVRDDRPAGAAEPSGPAASAPPGRPGRARSGGRGARSADGQSARPVIEAWQRFRAETGVETPVGNRVGADAGLVVRGDRVFAAPAAASPVPDAMVARPGTPLGSARPGRFEPAQGLAGRLSRPDVAGALEWAPDDARWVAYLHGEQVPDDGEDGWVLLTAHGWGVGWARRRAGMLKNFLPRSLRRQV